MRALVLGLLLLCGCSPLGQSQTSGDFAPGIGLSFSQSSLQIGQNVIASSAGMAVSLYLLDQYGAPDDRQGIVVDFLLGDGSAGQSTGTFDPPVTLGEGVYTTTFTGVMAGSAAPVIARINGVPISGPVNTIQVVPGLFAQLAFIQPPTNALMNQVITPAITVQAMDAHGNVIPDFNLALTLSLADNGNPGSTVPLGTAVRSPVGGVVTFDDISFGVTGHGYRIRVSRDDQGVSVESPSFDVL